MWLIILRDLQYRRWRVLATVVLMSIVMTLLFVMAGLVGQFRAEPGLATEAVGGDMHWIVPEGISGPLTSPQPLAFDEFPPTPERDPVVFARTSLDGELAYAISRNFRPELSPELAEGRLPQGPGEVAVDVTSGLDVGDTADLGGAPVEVVGTIEDATIYAGSPIVFTTLEFGQQVLTAGQDLVIATLTSDANPDLPPGFKVMSPDQVAHEAGVVLDSAVSTLSLVRALLWVITAIIIAAIVYVTALERTRDFAVLKAVGGRTRELGASLLVQGVVMTAAAVALAAILQIFIGPLFPLKVRVPSSALWQLPVTALIVAALAGLLGVSKVRSTSPAEAFE